MDTTKSSAPPTTRLERGVRLFHERGAEITRTTGGTFIVPSATTEGQHYVVYLGEITCCSCPDNRRAKANGEYCLHVHAAGIVAAKRRAARRRRAS
jgi:hypothetical protein